MNELWTFTWDAGPDAGGTTVLGSGSHVIGRAQGADVRCDDPAIEPHHVLAELTCDGVVIRQLTGRVPVRVDGRPDLDSETLTASAQLEIGHSLLTVTRGDLTAAGHAPDPANIVVTPSGNVVVRGPRVAALWAPDALTPPRQLADRSTTSGGVLPALLALGGSGLVAMVLHQPMFLIFGALGAIVAFGTWGGQRVSMFKRRRRDVRMRLDEAAEFEHAAIAQRDGFVAHHRANDSTPRSARQTIEGSTSDLWARRGSHADGFVVSVGLGSVAWAPLLDAESAPRRSAGDLGDIALLPDLPLTADLGESCRLAVRGASDRTRSIARSVVLQLAANCGPADMRVIVVTREPSHWRWLAGLPHATTAAGVVAVVTEADLADLVAEYDVAPHPHLVIVTDEAELLSARTSPLRRVLVAGRSVALVVLVAPDDGSRTCAHRSSI